jgi:uncharacterized RDD family membrane protein YckC
MERFGNVENIQHTSQTTQYGSFLRRLAAALIDSILLTIVLSVMLKIVGIETFQPEEGADPEDVLAAMMDYYRAAAPVYMAYVIVGWLYEALMTSSEKRATLGKMALGLTVTDTNGDTVSFWQATVRHFAKILSALTLFIGYLMQPFTEKKQALHDKLANTLVFKQVA